MHMLSALMYLYGLRTLQVGPAIPKQVDIFRCRHDQELKKAFRSGCHACSKSFRLATLGTIREPGTVYESVVT